MAITDSRVTLGKGMTDAQAAKLNNTYTKDETRDRAYIDGIVTSATASVTNYLTQAALLAYVPTVTGYTAKALDTKKVWYWNGSAWVDTGLSELDLAKADATTKANTAESNAISTAASDATTKANTAESNAITATTATAAAKADSVYNKIVTRSVGTIPPDTAITTPAASVTCVLGQPLDNGAVFSFVGGIYTATTTSIKVKVFDKVGVNFVVADSATATYTVGQELHTLDKNLIVNSGQYVGFYVVGGFAWYKSGTDLPLMYATTGDVTSVPVTKSYTNSRYQFYLKSAAAYVEKEITTRVTPLITDVTEVKQQVADLTKNLIFGLNTKPITDGVLATGNCILIAKEVMSPSVLQRVELFCKIPSTGIVFFFAKKLSEGVYTILFETAPYATTVGYNDIVFTVKKDVPVGSFFGWYDTSKSIPFDTSASGTGTFDYLACSKGTGAVSTNAIVYSGRPQIRFRVSLGSQGVNAVAITQSDYDILAVKAPNTLYLVV